MEVLSETTGGVLTLTPRGRLDAFGSKQLEESLRAGMTPNVLCVLLDLGAAPYLSSACLRVLATLQRDLAKRGGALAVARLNSFCREVLEISGFTPHVRVFEEPAEAAAYCARRVREAVILRGWDGLPSANVACGQLRFVPGEQTPAVAHVAGDLRDVLYASVKDSGLLAHRVAAREWSLGVGGMGSSPEEVAAVLGYTLALRGNVVWLATDDNDTPDFITRTGSGSGPAILTAYNVAFDDAFREYVMFESRDPAGAPLTDLYRALLDQARDRWPDYKGALAVAGWMETPEFHGVHLRRPPTVDRAPVNGRMIHHRDNAPQWLEGEAKPWSKNATCLVCGVAADLSADLSAYDERAFNACFCLQPANVGGRRELLLQHALVFGGVSLPRRAASLDDTVRQVVDQGEFLALRALQDATRVSRAFLGLVPLQEFVFESEDSGDSAAPQRYRIDERVGEGGMGVVYRAFDLILERPVAVKRLKAGLSEERPRFTLEAQTAAKLFKHPGVVTVLDLIDKPWPAIVMEFVQGVGLDALIRDQKLGFAEALDVLTQSADVLRYAHEMGVIHRDIKPQNLLVEGPPWRVKITDFGLAKVTGQPGRTQPGIVVGTPAYMSMEHASGMAVDHRTDIFAWGVMAYELCSGGRLPFGEEGFLSGDGYLAPPALEPLFVFVAPADARHELCALVMACIAEKPAGRPADFGLILKRLQRLGPPSSGHAAKAAP